jgi:hypothetical protein
MAKIERDEDMNGLTEAMGCVQLDALANENACLDSAPTATCDKPSQAKQSRAPLKSINIPKLIDRNAGNSSPPSSLDAKNQPLSSVRKRTSSFRCFFLLREIH